MTGTEAFLLAYILGLGSTIWIPSTLIRGYLKNKPYGLQTLLDRVACDLTYAVQINLTTFCAIVSLGILTR